MFSIIVAIGKVVMEAAKSTWNWKENREMRSFIEEFRRYVLAGGGRVYKPEVGSNGYQFASKMADKGLLVRGGIMGGFMLPEMMQHRGPYDSY